jgi:hypothetical protein
MRCKYWTLGKVRTYTEKMGEDEVKSELNGLVSKANNEFWMGEMGIRGGEDQVTAWRKNQFQQERQREQEEINRDRLLWASYEEGLEEATKTSELKLNPDEGFWGDARAIRLQVIQMRMETREEGWRSTFKKREEARRATDELMEQKTKDARVRREKQIVPHWDTSVLRNLFNIARHDVKAIRAFLTGELP